MMTIKQQILYGRISHFALFSLFFLFFIPLNAHSQSLKSIDTRGFEDVALALSGGVIPEYQGANDSETILFPSISGRYNFNRKHALSLTPFDGLNYSYTHNSKISYGLNLDYRRGRDTSDDPSLAGMADVDDSFEIGPWIRYKNGRFSLSTNLGFDVTGGHEGFVVETSGRYSIPIHQRWRATLSIGALYNDKTFADAYYSVSAAQTTSARPVFNANAGFSEISASIGLAYFLNDNAFVRGDIGFTRLLGDAQNSPVTLEDNQLRGFLTIGYQFD